MIYTISAFADIESERTNNSAITDSSYEVLIHLTPEWKDLTNKDGTGLFHEILSHALSNKNIKVLYVPVHRAFAWIKAARGDIAGTMTKGDSGFHYSRYPLWKVEIAVLFHQRLLANFNGLETLHMKSTIVGSAPGMSLLKGINVEEVATRHQAVYMLKKRRLDYYIDDRVVLIEFLNKSKRRLGFEGRADNNRYQISNLDDFVIRTIRTDYSYFLFPKNNKGKRIEKLFSQNLKKLYDSGKLRQIYKKWGLEHKLPDLDKFGLCNH